MFTLFKKGCVKYYKIYLFTCFLLCSYRLDGIERNPDVQASQYVIPYSPSGSQFYRFKLLMDGLIPSTGMQFPSDLLTAQEKVSDLESPFFK